MTLVSRFFVSDVPVLISDALLSTRAPLQQTPIPIPSVRTSEKHHGDAPTTMAGLVQKMTLIGENAVLCFAGDYFLGQDVLDYMKDRLAAGMHPEVAWDKMRKRFSLNSYSGVELIFEAMHPIGEGNIELISKSLGVRGEEGKYRSFDEAIFAGTGATHAKGVLARSDLGPVREIEGKYERAAVMALHVVAELLDIDMRNGASFDNHFGGFYEIAIWYGNKFKKIDGVQYVYWTVDVGEKTTSLTLDRIFLQRYEDNMLCVDEVLTDDSTPTKLDLTTEQHLPISNVLHHRIPSLSQGHHKQEFGLSSRTSFQQKLTVHCCRITDFTGHSTIGTIISGKLRSAHESETIRVTDSSVVLAKDVGQFLKDHLVLAMEEYRKMPEEENVLPAGKGIGERIRKFFLGT